MTTFDKREQAFEAQLAHDEELNFRAVARRDKWFALWAAEKLGKTGAEAEAYATDFVKRQIAERAEQALATLRADFETAGVTLSDHQIQRKLDELLAAAKDQIKRS